MQAIFKMLSLNNAPTVPVAEDDAVADVDEPPDPVPALHHITKDSHFTKASATPLNARRESLLTRAIRSDSRTEESLPQHKQYTGRGLSTASSHSATSMASTAELISDHSPARSCTPSPPVPSGFTGLPGAKPIASQVMIAPITKDDKPAVADVGEAAVEKTLGRKRCIMFACGSPEPQEEKPKVEPKEEPPKRRCALTFMCPTRQDSATDSILEAPKREQHKPSLLTKQAVEETSTEQKTQTSADPEKSSGPPTPLSPQTFHEFGSSHDETDAWVNNVQNHTEKLTVRDCTKKENAIRKLCEEAEEEAEEEEREEEEQMEELDDQVHEDDFAPSDDGNDSDDEAGFADSDDESDAGSDYQFWAPTAQSVLTAATSTENLSHISNRGRSRSRASSLESLGQSTSPPPRSTERPIFMKRRHRLPRMRPGTPELPDSTDFVCGTLDEDRPLEAAYISCLEQRKRDKHILIPQDIDPSFPTSDPEDEEDEEDEDESPGAGGPMWMKNQFDDFDDDSHAKTPLGTKSSDASPRNEFPFPRPQAPRRSTNRSPPPKTRCRSPPPAHNLFAHREHAGKRPTPHMRLRSPPASPRVTPAFLPQMEIGVRPFGRGRRERTSSLPRTPNPFFKHFNVGSPSISNVASGAVTPATEEQPRNDLHVRGPVDIVMGLQRKRQKRREKFWRQTCRKAAKEYAERKPIPGRGAVRMKELGLECAERNRGYGNPGQSTQLVISL